MKFILAAGLCLFLSGCSVASSPSAPVPAGLPTITFSASAYSVKPVSSVVLTVEAENADQVTVSGSDGLQYTLSAVGGTQSVTVTANTTYTATATGTGGCVSAAITISAE